MTSHLGARPEFVGRETQLRALQSAVDAGEMGERVLVLVAGEPGIGKSRLVAEVARRTSAHAVWAVCWEGDGAPANWPWVQVLRSVAELDEPVVADAISRLAGSTRVEPGADPRFQMFDAVAQGLAAASNTRSLLIVLDDLHWADESTVRLLQFLARDTRPRRLAVVGTYRDTDLDPSHPLAVGLSELVRDGLHLTLGGLGPRDVATLVRSVQPLDDKVAEADAAETAVRLHRQSGGNPFFLWELLQLERSDGARGGTPAGVRAVVSRRLQKLSGPARDALAAASVLGADVDAAIVCRLLDRRPQETLTAVAEAEAVGLVARTRDGAFRFVHDLVREVLYDELDVTTRANFHHRAVAALEERYGGARPAETAHHVFAAALSEPDERCVDYAVRAAERAWEVHAYEEAGHWYIRALQALPTGDPRESDLLLRNGEAQLAAGDLPAARAAYEQAARMARADHDAGLLARAALGLGAGLGGFEVQLLDPLQIDLLAESLRALGSEPSSMRAWVLARLSVALSVVADESRRRSLSAEAVEVARAAGDPQALGYALAAHCDAIPGPDWCDERALAAADIVGIGRETDDRQLELLGLRLQIVAQLETGDLGSADVTLERFALIADRLGQPLYRWYVPLWRGMRALMRGEFATAARHGAEAEQLGQRAASGNAVVLTFTQWWVRQRCEGHQAVAGSAMADLLGSASAEPRVTAGPRAVIAALVGDLEGARELLVEWLASGLADRTRDSEWLPESAQLAQVAVAAGVREVAERLYADLRPYADRFCVEGIGAAFTGSVAWYLALLARFLGHPTEADAYARQARAAHTRVGLTGDPPPLGGGTPSASPVAETRASLEWEGATWAVSWGGKSVRVRDSKGLRDLAVLLSRPQHEVHCLELVGGSDVGASPGPVLDSQARRAYEQRIRDLQSDIDEAREMADRGRAERAEDELDALVQQLSEAFGLAGRSRATGSAAERARSAVSWRIRAALRNLAEVHPQLARHLQNSVRTGTWCSYRPETEVIWTLRQGRSA